jgi:predicted aminopeptidase
MAARLAARGNDVMVGGVTAYSTLGHFSDPVLNTMLRYGDLGLVSTIFHELAHQLIYVRGDSEFNESFAVSVEQEGLRRWLAARGRSLELQDYLARHHSEQLIVNVFADGRRQLATLYATSPAPPREQLRVRKKELLSATGEQVLAVERQFRVRTGYDQWISDGLNNAHLASVGTYFDCVPGFNRLLAANGGNLPAFYAAVRRMKADAAARRALCADTGDGEPITAPGAAPSVTSGSATSAPATAAPGP